MNPGIYFGLDRRLIKHHFGQCSSHDVQRLRADIDPPEQRKLQQLQIPLIPEGSFAKIPSASLIEAGMRRSRPSAHQLEHIRIALLRHDGGVVMRLHAFGLSSLPTEPSFLNMSSFLTSGWRPLTPFQVTP
jgi:hypothetical protein